ncbi:hypothetical protein TNCV_2382881 [Trichonephila clavipes]|nr:hypothetical protein TNCV_2382881 [Trichonephila clavipes]
MNRNSVCGGMTVVDGYGSYPENVTSQPISQSVKLVLHCTSWFRVVTPQIFDYRRSLVYINGHLTVNRYVTQAVVPVVLPLLQGTINTVVQQENTMVHIAGEILKPLLSLTYFSVWPSSPYLNPIEDLWDLIGCT